MTHREKIIRGLQIAESVDPGGYTWGSHDIFSISHPNAHFNPAQVAELESLGFTHNDEQGWTFYCTG